MIKSIILDIHLQRPRVHPPLGRAHEAVARAGNLGKRKRQGYVNQPFSFIRPRFGSVFYIPSFFLLWRETNGGLFSGNNTTVNAICFGGARRIFLEETGASLCLHRWIMDADAANNVLEKRGRTFVIFNTKFAASFSAFVCFCG